MKKCFMILCMMLLATVSMPVNAITKSDVKQYLEQFCVEHYESCFSGRVYIEGSLTVTSMEIDENKGAIKVKGRHSYRGRSFFGYRQTHSGVSYWALIRPTNYGLKVEFHKWYEPDYPGADGHWEECTKTIIPEDD